MLHCNRFLTPGGPAGCNVLLVMLNTPALAAEALQHLWAVSSFRVCADGAANRLHDALLAREGEGCADAGRALSRESMLPDAITGDLDSAREGVLDFYSERGTRVVPNPSQDSNDLEKVSKLRPLRPHTHTPTHPRTHAPTHPHMRRPGSDTRR